ncbi:MULTISPECIES: L-rhamnose mutarotase [Bacteria]|uniref:L-rhamnose mutarotase n=1 Tax=Bacteria TaxID=2 RepID=UPI003C7C09C2
MRYALHSTLIPGQESAYERAHARIPADLEESFDRLGIHDWTIWRSGSHLFHLVEADDLDEAMRALENDPANVRWQRSIGVHLTPADVDARTGRPATPAPLGRVWRLADQSDETTDS